MRIHQVIAAGLLIGAMAMPATAQEHAWFIAPDSLTQVAVTNQGRTWSPIATIGLPNHSPSQAIAIEGGRYLVWAAYRPDLNVLARYDTVTREVAIFPSLTFTGATQLVAVDRQHDLLVVLDMSFVYLVDVAGLRVVGRIPVPFVAAGFLDSVSLGVASGRAFIGHRAPYVAGQTFVLDVMTGAVIATIPDVWNVQVARDDTRVYLQSDTSGATEVQVWDPRALSLITTDTTDAFIRVVAGNVISEKWQGPGQTFEVRVHEPTTLEVVYRAFIAIPSDTWMRDLQEASPRSPIVFRTMNCAGGFCHDYCISVFDRATLSFVGEWIGAPFDRPGSLLVMVAPPDAPGGLRAEVNGGVVNLEWNPPPDVAVYEVSAGLLPGVYNIGTIRTAVPSLRVDSVPPGTYYVRVRAINHLGSAQSSELSVVVP